MADCKPGNTHFWRLGGLCQCREAGGHTERALEATLAPNVEQQFVVGDRVRWLVDGLPNPVAGTVTETYRTPNGPWWCARVRLDNGLTGAYFQQHLIPANEVRCIYGASMKAANGN